ncbi:aldo/keto reductase [soil metagenome]
MKKRRLGAQGPEIGLIGLGCLSFSGFYGATNEEESHRTLARAADLGIDHLDTANVYGAGVSESVIGGFLRKTGARFTIATKAGITRNPDHPFDNAPDYLRRCLEESLRRLGVEHVDLYYVHRREQARPIEEVVETLARFRKEGKIGAIGLSEVAPSTLERASAVHPIAAVQSEYSLWTRLPELGLVAACARHGAALMAFSPLARGMFTASPPDPAKLDEKDFRKRNPRFMAPNAAYNLATAARLAAYARDNGHSPEALALAWLLHRAPHVVPLPGTRSAEHLAANAKGAEIALTAAQIAEIEDLLPAGFAHGNRYSAAQDIGPERYC